MITLTLKGRKVRNGIPNWHDRAAVENAIVNIMQEKAESAGKNFLWANILGKIEEKAEELNFGERVEIQDPDNPDPTAKKKVIRYPDIPIEINSNQAHQLWKVCERYLDEPSRFYPKEMKCARCGNTVGTVDLPDAGVLCVMLKDIAGQLGEKWVDPGSEEGAKQLPAAAEIEKQPA